MMPRCPKEAMDSADKITEHLEGVSTKRILRPSGSRVHRQAIIPDQVNTAIFYEYHQSGNNVSCDGGHRDMPIAVLVNSQSADCLFYESAGQGISVLYKGDVK